MCSKEGKKLKGKWGKDIQKWNTFRTDEQNCQGVAQNSRAKQWLGSKYVFKSSKA